MRIVKPPLPFEMMCKIERMIAKDASDNDMRAHENIPISTYFAVGSRVFLATQTIVNGEKIEPGINCDPVNMADALNELNQ